MAPEANGKGKSIHVDIPEHAVKNLTVEEMYDKEKYDLSTMKEGDVFKMLEYVKQKTLVYCLIIYFSATRDGLTDDQVNERLEKVKNEKSLFLDFVFFI